MRNLVFAPLAALLSVGCVGESGSVQLVVQTDLAPGVDFAWAEVAQIEPLSGVNGERVFPGTEVRVVPGDMFRDGRTLSRFTDVTPGTLYFRARLRREDGTLLVENRVVARVLANTNVVRVRLDRNCVGVECPVAGGSPGLIACVGGRCVDPALCNPPEVVLDCSGEVMGGAAGSALCNADTDCPRDVLECGRRYVCEGTPGTCRLGPSECGAGLVCSLEGCVTPGGGGLDAGAMDVGTLPDAGSADVGTLACGTFCTLPDDPCRYGYVQCAGATSRCEPLGNLCDSGVPDAGSDAGPDAGPGCLTNDVWNASSGLLPDEAGWGVSRPGAGYARLGVGVAAIDTSMIDADQFIWTREYAASQNIWTIRARMRVVRGTSSSPPATSAVRGVSWIHARRGDRGVALILREVGVNGSIAFVSLATEALLPPVSNADTSRPREYELVIDWASNTASVRFLDERLDAGSPDAGAVVTLTSTPYVLSPAATVDSLQIGDGTQLSRGITEWQSIEVSARSCP
jgi:hypothetical protein